VSASRNLLQRAPKWIPPFRTIPANYLVTANIMKTFAHFRHILCSVVGIFSLAAGAGAADITSADQSFVKQTYETGLAEVRMGQLGQNKTANSDVKAFAARLVADHGKASAELKTLAETKGLSLPSSPSLAAQGHARMLDMKAGADFDKAFTAHTVSGFEKTVAAFEKAGSETKDTDIRAFITKTLPTLKEHLTMAQTLQAKVGK